MGFLAGNSIGRKEPTDLFCTVISISISIRQQMQTSSVILGAKPLPLWLSPIRIKSLYNTPKITATATTSFHDPYSGGVSMESAPPATAAATAPKWAQKSEDHNSPSPQARLSPYYPQGIVFIQPITPLYFAFYFFSHRAKR